MGVVRVIAFSLRALLRPRASIAAENLAWRQQLGVLRRSVLVTNKPRLATAPSSSLSRARAYARSPGLYPDFTRAFSAARHEPIVLPVAP